MLEHLENELSKYEFDTDKNFIMNSRRKTLKGMIEDRLQKNEGNTNELVSESLFNFWEFVDNEYPGNIISDVRELGITIKEFDLMDKAYREKGVICFQEKEIILGLALCEYRPVSEYFAKHTSREAVEEICKNIDFIICNHIRYIRFNFQNSIF